MGDLADRIKAAEDRPFDDQDIPEWDVKVRIRGLSGTDRDAYESAMIRVGQGGMTGADLANFRVRLVAKCLCDPETNERIFADSELSELGAKSAVVIGRLFRKAQELSGMDVEALARAEGNSETGQSGSSTTG